MSKANLYIGTSGYGYAHWKKIFYPEVVKSNKWLEYYSKNFSTVELNVTFYRLPTESAFLSWRARTPEDFTFAVKGSRFITHVKRLKDCKESVKLFFTRVKLLKNKLGVILWQLAPSFKADIKRLSAFLKLLGKYKNVRHAFEFRNETWFCGDVFKLLRSESISLTSADKPSFCNDIIHTADFVYIRRHGAGGGLYSGNYSKARLKKDAKIIKKHLNGQRDVFIYFNNDAHGYAVKNALELKKLCRK